MRHTVRTACLLLGLIPGLGLIQAAAGQWVKPNDPAYQRYPADPHLEGLFLLCMEEAWKIEKGSPKVVIGIIDLAFDATHPDLKNQLWTNPREIPGNGKDDDGNGLIDDVHGWDFVDGDNTLDGEQAEHGTHVAGIIAAEANNGIGIAGMASGCRLMLVKVGVAGCLRDGTLQARAIRYCVDNGARLICMNHGLSEFYPGWHVPAGGQLKEACDYAYRKGVLIVTCTTSNDGKFYPATFPPAYDAVMGTGASDIFGKPSDMYGGSRFCEVIAPGGEREGGPHNPRSIYSCYCGDRKYHYYSGGCMATPHVVGLLALVLSHYPGLDVEQARQIVRNTARSEKSEFDVRWGYGLIQPVAALSLRPKQIAPRPELQSVVPTKAVAKGKPAYVASVRNEGALDARVRLSLVRAGHKLADQVAMAHGLKTTDVWFPADRLPPPGELTIHMEGLGMARPRMCDDVLDVKLSVADNDLAIRQEDDGRQVLVVRVHNAGTVDAGRVVVVLHHHEPAVAQRKGPPSQMLDAQVVAVPGSGTAEAEFTLDAPTWTSDLWVEIEQLDVGAPHVPKDRGKARLPISSAATLPRLGPFAKRPARPLVRFKLAEGQGDRVADSLENKLAGTIRDAQWTTDGPQNCLRFNGTSSSVEVPDHPSLSGMKALQIDARVKFEQPLRTIEPLVYKWRSGLESASFGLGLLDGHPYVLLRTTQTGYGQLVCKDLTVKPSQWHTVSLLYTGTTLTAMLDGQPSNSARIAYGAVDSCPHPLRLGSATDRGGKPVSFLRGMLSDVGLSVPGTPPVSIVIPGRLEMDKVVRVLLPREAETFFFELSEPAAIRIHATLLEGTAAAAMHLSLRAKGSAHVLVGADLSRQQPALGTRLEKGRYVMKLDSRERIAYRLSVKGVADVWQETFRATDRGAGATAHYVAWLSTSAPGKGVFEVFNCSEGSRFLFLAPPEPIQTVIQTGGVMGDSSVPQGGAGVWRQHSFAVGVAPGAWFYYPSDINASGDYAVRGNFTIHWRRPDDEQVLKAFLESPTMLVRKLKIRGGETTLANRRQRYQEAIRSGLKFMATLTEKRDDGYWMFERWLVDRQGPRSYWGNDGQMLCARTFYHAFQCDHNPQHQAIALGMGRRVIGSQQLNANQPRFGALPYGLIGDERKVSWASSNNIQGKILYGLAQLAAASGDEQLLAALRLNADYYARIQYPDGRWAHFVEKMPESLCGYATAWGTAGLLVAYGKLGDRKYLETAERALAAYRKGRTPKEGLRPDGSLLCHCNHANSLEDDHAIRSSITMLTPYALAYRITRKPEYRKVLDELYRYLAVRQHASGVIKQFDNDCVNLIYAQNWGPQGFCEAYEATGDEKFLQIGVRLADFFVRIQLVDGDPHLNGAWVGNYNVVKDLPGGNIDDEGNLYDLYTSWGAGPIVYGLARLMPQVDKMAH
jgi:hypothetical protein